MKKTIIISLTLLFSIIFSGCGPVIGLIVDILPKADIPAKFEMNDKKVLVFVNTIEPDEVSSVFVHTLSKNINSELIKNNAASSIVDFSKISDLLINTNEIITASYAGKELAADIVVKIDIQNLTFDFRNADNCRVGQVLCYITVFDVQTEKRLWPKDQLKQAMLINSRLEINSDEIISSSQVQRNLAKTASIQISKLFYKHKAD